MSDRVTVKVVGFKELERALMEELPKATAKNALRRSGINAMKLIETRAKSLVPKDQGALAKSITTKAVKAKKRQKGSAKFEASKGVEIETGPTGRPEGGNAAWQEYGTVKMPANPYMRPAADSEAGKVISEIRDQLETQIKKAKDRIARKAAKGK